MKNKQCLKVTGWQGKGFKLSLAKGHHLDYEIDCGGSGFYSVKFDLKSVKELLARKRKIVSITFNRGQQW